MSVDDLKAERSALQTRAVSLAASIGRLVSLRDDVAVAERNLADHDHDASDELLNWARQAGPDDPMPESDPLARMSLARVAARAKANLINAGAASDQLAADQREVHVMLAEVDAKIADYAYDALIAERETAMKELHDFCERELKPRLARVASLKQFFADRGRALQATNQDAAINMLRRVGRIIEAPAELPEAAMSLSTADINADAAHWRNRFGELHGDDRVKQVLPVDPEQRRREIEADGPRRGDLDAPPGSTVHNSSMDQPRAIIRDAHGTRPVEETA